MLTHYSFTSGLSLPLTILISMLSVSLTELLIKNRFIKSGPGTEPQALKTSLQALESTFRMTSC